MDFLDLTHATDTEKNEIREILSSSKVPGVELPFEFEEFSKLELGQCQRPEPVENLQPLDKEQSVSYSHENIYVPQGPGLRNEGPPRNHLNHHSGPFHVDNTQQMQPIAHSIHHEGAHQIYQLPPHLMQPALSASGPTAMSTVSYGPPATIGSGDAGFTMGEMSRSPGVSQFHPPHMPPYPFIAPNGHFVPTAHGPPFAAPSHMYHQNFYPPFHFQYFVPPNMGHHPNSPGQQFNFTPEPINMHHPHDVDTRQVDECDSASFGHPTESDPGNHNANEEELKDPQLEVSSEVIGSTVLSDSGVESINGGAQENDVASSESSAAASKSPEPSTDHISVEVPSASNKSWASLFNKRGAPANASLPSPPLPQQASLTDSPLPSSFPGLDEQAPEEPRRQRASQERSFAINLVDAQITSIPVEEDPLAGKLGKKLKDVHLKHTIPYMLPRGLINRGNWCYINATLQALLVCPPFYNLMREIAETPGVFREPSSTPITDSFAKFFANFHPSNGSSYRGKSGNIADELPKLEPLEPKCIYDVLGAIQSECLKGKQEDAEEFLSSVLNGIHDEMTALMKFVDNEQPAVNGDGALNGHVEEKFEQTDDGSVWKEVGAKHKTMPTRSAKVVESPLMSAFGGSTLSVRTATGKAGAKDVCGNRQPFFTLKLDIQPEKVKSVEDAIKHFTAPESLQGFTCPKTGQIIDASYQTFIDQLPPVLILHMKCFVFDKDGGSKKLVKQIDYPIDLEFPRESLKERTDKTKYKLLAVVFHDGTDSYKGHYVTDIYHIGSSRWVRCDDSSVKAITVEELLHPKLPRLPYLLFYRRCDTLHVNGVNGGGRQSSQGGNRGHAPH